MVYVSLAFLLCFGTLGVYYGILAWRSTAESWRLISLKGRPRSWQRWPVYSAIWRDFDRHTRGYLWLARILAPVSVLLAALGVFALGRDLLRLQ